MTKMKKPAAIHLLDRTKPNAIRCNRSTMHAHITEDASTVTCANCLTRMETSSPVVDSFQEKIANMTGREKVDALKAWSKMSREERIAFVRG